MVSTRYPPTLASLLSHHYPTTTAITYRHRACIKASPFDSPCIQEILKVYDVVPPRPDHYLIVMFKYGTDAEGSPFNYDDIAHKLNNRFTSQLKLAPESGIGLRGLWTEVRVSEPYNRLEMARGEIWNRWSALEKGSEEVQKVLNDC